MAQRFLMDGNNIIYIQWNEEMQCSNGKTANTTTAQQH